MDYVKDFSGLLFIKVNIFKYNNKLIIRLMDGTESMIRSDKIEAGKKIMKEKLRLDYISSGKGYVVAGCILDIVYNI